MKWPTVVTAELPFGVVTMMFTRPLPAGLITVICVAVSKRILPGAPPKVTPVAPPRPLPEMMTLVPPVVPPLAGVIPMSAGATGPVGGVVEEPEVITSGDTD